MLEVVDGGLLTTVQDSGRPNLGHLGVPHSGACDPWSLAVANLLVGNAPGDAALEMTLLGPVLRVVGPVVIGVAGADLGGVEEPGGRRLLPGHSYAVRAGATLAFRGAAAPDGVRAYLALPGGIDVPPVLGSRSTCLVGGFGGLDGRALRAGDRLVPRLRGAIRDERAWPVDARPGTTPGVVRTLPGPFEERFGPTYEALLATPWRVTPAGDRMGVRLHGPPLPRRRSAETLSHGVVWGTVQVPPDGPIVLLADHQPTGGYPVAAVACIADRPVVGQLAPGTSVEFAPIGREEALVALRVQRAALRRGAAAIDAPATKL